MDYPDELTPALRARRAVLRLPNWLEDNLSERSQTPPPTDATTPPLSPAVMMFSVASPKRGSFLHRTDAGTLLAASPRKLMSMAASPVKSQVSPWYGGVENDRAHKYVASAGLPRQEPAALTKRQVGFTNGRIIFRL